jgi:LysM repeat protein
MGLDPAKMEISYELEASIDQLTTALVDQGQVECKAQLRLAAMILQDRSIENLTRISSSPVDMQKLRQQPGMIGYITKPGESLWDIAKAYRVTVQQLAEQNELPEGAVQPGTKLMIVRSM